MLCDRDRGNAVLWPAIAGKLFCGLRSLLPIFFGCDRWSSIVEPKSPKPALGKTVGEALDALLRQLSEEEAGTLVIVQNYRPDRFFSAEQQKRLSELMNRWRDLRDSPAETPKRDRDLTLPPQDRAELNALVEAELNASAARTAALFEELKG